MCSLGFVALLTFYKPRKQHAQKEMKTSLEISLSSTWVFTFLLTY